MVIEHGFGSGNLTPSLLAFAIIMALKSILIILEYYMCVTAVYYAISYTIYYNIYITKCHMFHT